MISSLKLREVQLTKRSTVRCIARYIFGSFPSSTFSKEDRIQDWNITTWGQFELETPHLRVNTNGKSMPGPVVLLLVVKV